MNPGYPCHHFDKADIWAKTNFCDDNNVWGVVGGANAGCDSKLNTGYFFVHNLQRICRGFANPLERRPDFFGKCYYAGGAKRLHNQQNFNYYYVSALEPN